VRRARDRASTGRDAERVDDHRLPSVVYALARRVDNAGLRLLDAGVVAVAWLLAYIAGFEGDLPSELSGTAWAFLGIPVVTQLIANQIAGLYGPVWRYASVEEAARVVAAVAGGTAASAVMLALSSGITDVDLPLFTTPPVAAMLILLGCGGIRFQARLFAIERMRTRGGERQRTLIVGAGPSGAALARELKAKDDLELVGFVDDAPNLRGRSVRGLRVLGTTDDLEAICRDRHIERVIVALPNTVRERTQEIVGLALRTDAQVKVLPPSSDRLHGPLVRSLRDLDLADLLGREHAPVDPRGIAGYLEGATVLVTGAGGSIGSEIARQVARFRPERLLLLDRDESLLHETLVGELAGAEPVLVDIRDRGRIEQVFRDFVPDVVFHAAAHKHVPMLERHPIEAVSTNLLGTWWLALTAATHGCRRFVHVSTDKAAHPCSVMGATKRAAELVVFDVGSQHDLPVAAVRFGNVLGSRGSVVPTFLRQIVDGGPVTVTDPEMTRYFMTIPEAVSLVLQAGAMVDEGRIFLLEMGRPVSIVDLARQMIRLAGLRPDDDIPIEIIGRRPGERLHEQLHDSAESVDPTSHPSIRGVTPITMPDEETLFFFLELLQRQCAEANAGAVATLLEQFLRQSGVECQLRFESADNDAVASFDLRTEGAARPALPTRRVRTTTLPALLGGPAAFSPPLPFARPPRLPLERVTKRLAPSYEQGILTNGPLVAELEQRIATRLGVPHVVAVSSCTSGLLLTVQALTEGRDGPVVLPSFTFAATGHAVAWNRRRLHFVDCDPHTFQIDVEHAAPHLTEASALLATHVFGAPCTPTAVAELGREHGVPVIFDAAHALGASSGDLPVGRFGDAEVFSLTPTKVLVAGEGGLVATYDTALAETLRIGRDYGNPGDYDTRFAGLNARMSEFHAAMALESLELLDELLERRRALAEAYRKLLADVPGVTLQQIPHADASTFKDLTIAIEPPLFGLARDDLVHVLAAEGVDTRTYFDPPVHRQQAYGSVSRFDLPVTDRVAASVVSLPIYPDLSLSQVERVVEVIVSAHVHADELQDVVEIEAQAASLSN
jgi:FlaA1/EpsC-like NDP-sugar epimerase/dTDP-4-amino-4,6-dideoxygalactose transaminase